MDNIETPTQIVHNNGDIQGDLSAVAQKFYDEKKYSEALKIYTDMLLYSSDSDLYVKMGICFEKLDKIQTALEYWKKAIDIDPLNSNAYINLGNYYYKKGKVDSAIGYWIASLISMPEEPTANLNLAVAYTHKNMSFEAFSYYEKYLKYAQERNSEKFLQIQGKVEKNKKLANNYLKLGIQYQGIKDNISAKNCYKKAQNYCPTLPKAPLNLGSIYYIEKNYEKAVAEWTKALYLDPYYHKILINLALSYDALAQFDYAYCYYTRYGKMVMNNQSEYLKVVARCQKIKPFLNANPYHITRHLEHAKDAFENCDYYKALLEYTNYIILNPQEQETYGDLIKKLESYLNPEYNVTALCNEKGQEYIDKRAFRNAIPYFARILILSKKGTLEYNDANRKLGLCLQHSQ